MVVRVGLARKPVDDGDAFLYHKTTRREVYDEARTQRPDCDDVILWNGRGELTESTIANLALRIQGQWYTPPIESGLLPGVMRAHLLDEGHLREGILTKDDLAQADEVGLFNSVRKWMDVEFIG